MSLSADFQKLSVQGLITLYKIDATKLGAGILYFHGHTNTEDWKVIYSLIGDNTEFIGDSTKFVGESTDENTSDTVKALKRNIVFNGITYTPVAIDSEGLEQRGDGKASSPTLSMANNIDGVQGAVSAYCLNFNDFAGAKVTVITTLAKYLDSINFSEGNPTAANEYKKQIWYIEQKTSENALQVTFELSNPIDFEGQRIPCREINNYCQWAINGGYRGESCGYIGAAMYTEEDKPTDNPELDKCSGRLQGCKIRFGSDNALPFGGFPSSSMNDR